MIRFVRWEGRPAVFDDENAWAVLEPGQGWTKVDYWDVRETGAITHEASWHEYFREEYGELAPPGMNISPSVSK